ncbi:conserved hypothetical protein [Ricinus communis]|uniref:Uncharacterized protein n=1 Tax=Ricinus communis TaxID=3988 RepID=B9TCC8_RICCO|nr:conserved hypothetical protein [Ricinus communis]
MALKKASRPGEPPRARQACMAPKAISSTAACCSARSRRHSPKTSCCSTTSLASTAARRMPALRSTEEGVERSPAMATMCSRPSAARAWPDARAAANSDLAPVAIALPRHAGLAAQCLGHAAEGHEAVDACGLQRAQDFRRHAVVVGKHHVAGPLRLGQGGNLARNLDGAQVVTLRIAHLQLHAQAAGRVLHGLADRGPVALVGAAGVDEDHALRGGSGRLRQHAHHPGHVGHTQRPRQDAPVESTGASRRRSSRNHLPRSWVRRALPPRRAHRPAPRAGPKRPCRRPWPCRACRRPCRRPGWPRSSPDRQP